MSGLVAAAQSGGCCCTPQPSLGCRQTEATAYLQAVDDFEELSASFSISSLRSVTYLRDCGLNCTGATSTTQWASSGLLLEKEATSIAWRTRVPVSAGSGSQSAGICRGSIQCCTRPCWDITNPFCFPNQSGTGEGAFICACVQEAIILVAPPNRCQNDYTEMTQSVCAQCAPSNPVNYYNQWNVRGQSVKAFATINFVCGFLYTEPCGLDPANQTFCRFELTIYSMTTTNCPDGPVQSTGGGVVYVKKCCNYAEGPLGTYVLRDAIGSGSSTDADDCRIITTTTQASPFATVTRA